MAIYSLRLTPIGKTTQKRPFTAAAHVRYIARSNAASHVLAARMPEEKGKAQRWLRKAERDDRANARVADKMVIALPVELSLDQQVALVHRFAETLTKGRAAWFAALHAKGKDRKNPHCHLLVRDRDMETGKRVVMFSAGPKEVRTRKAKGEALPTTLHDIRALWEQHINEALAAAGSPARVDRRRLAAQGIARRAQVHEGPNIRSMQARGYRPRSADRVYRNRPGRRTTTPSTRTVRYADIDRGRTRAEYNDALRATARASLMAPERLPSPVARPVAVPARPSPSPLPVRAAPLPRAAPSPAPRAHPVWPARPAALQAPRPATPELPPPPMAPPVPAAPERTLSLAERLIQSLVTTRATPQSVRDRDRDRGR
jgi:hypothetical protein